MAIEKLTQTMIDALKKTGALPKGKEGKRGRKGGTGWYGDGGNLWLQLSPTGNLSWTLRFTRNGKQQVKGLGPLHTVDLKEARARAAKHRLELLDGLVPVTRVTVWTFEEAAKSCHKLQATSISNGKHYAAWLSQVTRFCKDILKTPVRDITREELADILRPIWSKKKGATLRERLEKIFDHAIGNNQRSGENPAKLNGERGLVHLLGKRAKKKSGRQQASVPHTQIAEVIKLLRAREHDIIALALEFTILTATSTGDVRGGKEENKPPMRWAHLDPTWATWTIPSTKIDSTLVVPLSDAARAVLKRVKEMGLDDDVVFASPRGRAGEPIGRDAMWQLAKELDSKATTHGFRATFKTWATEKTTFEKGIIEVALRHRFSDDETEATYMRGALLEKRGLLMTAWADYVDGRNNVVTLTLAAA